MDEIQQAIVANENGLITDTETYIQIMEVCAVKLKEHHDELKALVRGAECAVNEAKGDLELFKNHIERINSWR